MQADDRWLVAARRVPGYRWVRRRVARVLRRSRVVDRLLGLSSSRGAGHPPRFSAGAPRARAQASDSPIVVFVALDLVAGAVAAAVGSVASVQETAPSFRAFFVVDAPEFGALRTSNYPAEVIVPRAAWAKLALGGTWEDYAAARVRSVVHRYRAAVVIPVPANGWTPHEIATSLLASLPS